MPCPILKLTHNIFITLEFGYFLFQQEGHYIIIKFNNEINGLSTIQFEFYSFVPYGGYLTGLSQRTVERAPFAARAA